LGGNLMTTKELIVQWLATQTPEQTADLLLLPKTRQKELLGEYAAQQIAVKESALSNADQNLEVVKANLRAQIDSLKEALS
jgi:hypothetical protein